MAKEKTDYYPQLYPIARYMIDRRFDRTVTGEENILDEPAVYVPNHIIIEDSPIVAVSFTETTGRPLRFVAKQEFFDGKGIDDKGKWGRMTRWVVEHTHMIPIDRESTSPRDLMTFQNTVAHRLRQGDSVALHPEGTRSDDGKLHKFRSGAARIAIAEKVPIVPVGLVYGKYSNNRKTHVDVMFGQPILVEEYTKLPHALLPRPQKANHFMNVAEERVAELTGMNQTGAFAQLRKFRKMPRPEETPEV